MFEISKEVIGQKSIIRSFLGAIFCNGHVLIEGVPGLAKTVLIKTLSNVFGSEFSRVQFTADLLPSDIIGINTFNKETSSFKVVKGPIFTNLLLADEINRASPKVQSALLECMAERQTTIGGATIELPKPFFVFATQNPLESLGTYPLPQAQLDRFLFKLYIKYPNFDEELSIISLVNSPSQSAKKEPLKQVLKNDDIIKIQQLTRNVFVSESIKIYITRIISATRGSKSVELSLMKYVSAGCGPRATLGLVKAAQSEALMQGRDFVIPVDVKNICKNVLRHRLEVNYLGQSKNVTSDQIIEELLAKVPIH
jgi:MoxR-like ATPase